SAHRTDPERPRHQCLHQCRQRGDCRIQGAKLSQYEGSALSLTQRFGAGAAGSDRAHDHRDGLAGLTARNPFKTEVTPDLSRLARRDQMTKTDAAGTLSRKSVRTVRRSLILDARKLMA